MALQIWLPLNGNLNNQGLGTAAPDNSNIPVYKNYGKLFNQSIDLATRVYFNCPELASIQQWTVAFWGRVEEKDDGTDWKDLFGFTDVRVSDGVTGNFRFETGYSAVSRGGIHFHDNATYAITNRAYTFNNASARGEWHHIAVTVSNTQIKSYYDGDLVDTGTVNGGSWNTSGRFYIGETNQLNGCMQDLRIWDESISALEVKKISQGLVLHYPLSMPGQENLLVPQISDNKWANWSASTWDSTNTREKIVGDDGKTWAHIIQNTTAGYGGYTCSPSYNQIVIDSSKKYTWSCIAKAGAKENAEIILWYHWRSTEGGANLSQSSKKFQLTSSPQRISWTLPQYTNDTYTVNRINLMMGTHGTGNNEIYFTDVKFEEGSRPTPWLPNQADTKYTALGFNDGIEYDVSGYKHNGTKYGAITYDADTPRYETSTHISATDQYIKVENLYTSGFGNSYTFSWWSKVSTFSNMQWGFSNGVRLNGMYTGKLWNTGDSSNNPLYIPNTTTQVTVPTTSVWHHWVMTGDGTTCRVYQDGELWGIAKTYKSISGTTLCINGWNDTTSYKNSYMIISDFRIYATCLSPQDVRDLYSVAASVSDNGTLMASEVSEL